ncbi:MAG: diguanylate cyclase [Herpetosiphon sp.]
MRVLIAEDDGMTRLILQTAVAKFGHECMVAANGTTAAALCEDQHFDVILSDWMMPGMSGLELCQVVRARPGANYTYFIFLTSLVDKSHIREGIEAGADDYLSKPLVIDELEVRLLVASRVTALYRHLSDQKAELERLNSQLFAQGRTDALTHLSNRLRLREDLDTIADRVATQGSTYCAVMCDVDAFKLYNDHYGHAAGDRVLAMVAATMVRQCRAWDGVYRYGGEEFLIIVPDQSTAVVKQIAKRVCRAVEALAIAHEKSPVAPTITVSAGIAHFTAATQQTVASWLKEADMALYHAKQSGRNQVFLYSDIPTENAEIIAHS